MDYFKFDLQLFAVIDLTNAAAAKQYYHSGVANWDNDPTSADDILAKLDGTTLYVVEGNTIKDAAASVLTSVTSIKLVAGIATADGTPDEDSALTVGTLALEDNDENSLGSFTGITKGGEIASTSTFDFTFAKDITFTTAGTVAVKNTSSAAGKTIKVSQAGVVSAIDDGASFTVEGTAGKFTYAMSGATLVQTGAEVGVYTKVQSTTTVTAAGVVSGGTAELAALTLTLDEASANAGTTYYTVSKAGAVSAASVADEPVLSADVIGYFKVVTSENSGNPSVTVSFKGYAANAAASATAYAGNLTVNAANIATIGSAKLSSIDVTGISAATTINNLYSEADATGAAVVNYAAVTPDSFVDFTSVAANLENADKFGYYATIEGKTAKWFTTIDAITTEADGKSYVITAAYQNKVLTVAAGGNGKVVNLKNVDADKLNDVTVKLTQSFSDAGVASDGDISGTLMFDNTTTDLDNVTVKMAAGDAIVFDKTVDARATFPAGAKLTTNTGNNIYTMNAASVLLLTTDGTQSTLVDGDVSVKPGKALAVNGNVYTVVGDNAARITGTATYKADGTIDTPAQIGTLVTYKDGENNDVYSTVSVAEASAVQMVDSEGNVVKVTATDEAAVVDSAGVISGLANGNIVAVTDGKTSLGADITTTYTVGATSVAVSGNYIGVYTVTDPTDVTITSIYGKPDTVEENGAAAALIPLSAGITWNADSAYCYWVKDDGTVTEVATEAAAITAIASGDGIGYFKLDGETAGGDTTLTVSFMNADGTAAETLLPGVTIDLKNIADVGGKAITKVDVSGISAGQVKLSGVPITADGNVIGLKNVGETGGDTLAFAPSYVLADGFTITIPDGMTDKDVWAYEITAPVKDASKNIHAYTLSTTPVKGTTTSAPDLTGAAYFKITKTEPSVGKNNYKVEFVAHAGSEINLANLNEKCWTSGIAVDATKFTIPAETVATVEITSTGAGKETYTVSARTGTVVAETTPTNKAVTGSWDPVVDPTITYDDGAAEPEKRQFITLPVGDTTVAGEFWKVEMVNDGNNSIKITKVNAVGDAGANYLKVVVDGDTDKTTVTYVTDGTIKLSDLKKKNNDPVQVVLQTPDDFAGKIINIADSGWGKADCVDWEVHAPAGTTISGNDKGDTIKWITAFKNAAVIDLDALAKSSDTDGTYWYALEATDAETLDKEGYRTVTVVDGAPVKSESVPDTTTNYFKVVKNADGTYTVTYQVATTGDDKIATFATGETTLSVNGNEAVKGIAETTTAAGDKYYVDKATDALGALTVTPDPGGTPISEEAYVGYVATSKFTDGAGTADASIALAGLVVTDLTAAKSIYYSITKAPVVDLTAKGVTKYKVDAAGSAQTPGLTVTYVPKAGVEPAYLKITLTQGTLTKAEIDAIVNAIKIDATLDASIDGKISKIVLTDDTKGNISYAITKLDADIELENFTTGKDTVAYAESFVMGDANTITLAAHKTGDAATTKYYAVTATDGKDTKMVRTVSISTTPVSIPAGASAPQIAELLAAAGGNYFTVTTDEDGGVTVSYTKNTETPSKAIDLTDLKVNVNANAVTQKDADVAGTAVTVGAAGDSKVTYVVSGLDYGQTTSKAGTAVHDPAADKYNASYAFGGTDVVLTGATSGTEYYSVKTEADGAAPGGQGRTVYKLTKEGDPADKTNHYIEVKYAATGITVTYFNVDGDEKYNLATVMADKQITVNTGAIDKAITAINITDGTTPDTPKANYALTEVRADVAVIGAGEGDTVTKKPEVVWASNQTMTLTDLETAYYTLTGVLNETTKKVEVSISAGVNTKPAETANYFVVKRTADEKTGKVSYAITGYHASNGDAAYDLTGEKAGTLTVDAAKATGGIDLHNDNSDADNLLKAHIAVTNLPEYNLPDHMYATAPKDTVSYTTTFAWATETVPDKATGGKYTYQYLVQENADGEFILTPGATATTSTEDAKTKYTKVTVTKDTDGNFTVTRASTNYFTVDATGALVDSTNAAKITSIVAPTTACVLDASDAMVVFVDRSGVGVTPVVTPLITGVVDGSTIKLNDQDVTVVSGTLNADDTITIVDAAKPTVPKDEETFVFTAGDAGTISLTHNADAVTVDSGVLLLGKGDSLTATKGAAVVSLAADGTSDGVVVTFDATKGVASITDLDAGEALTIGGYVYTLGTGEYDGFIIKTKSNDSSDKTYAAGTSTSDILSLGYTKETSITGVVGTFQWYPDVATAGGAKAYYLEASASAATVEEGDGTGDVGSGYYVKAEFKDTTGGDGKTDTLQLTPMRGNAKGLLDPVTDYDGTITLVGGVAAINLVKEKGASYKLAVTNAITGSTFTDLGADDTVTTKALAIGNTIVMQFMKADGSAVDDAKTATYTAAVAGEMVFHGAALYNGSVTIATASKTLTLSDGSTVTSNVGTSQTLVVENGAIKAIKDMETANEKVTVVKDGVTTEFLCTVAGSITKTVTKADGSVTKTTITLTAAGDDVWNAAGTTKFDNNFAWNAKDKSGYFKIDKTTGISVDDVKGDTTAAQTMNNGDVYVKATITDVTGGVSTLTLTPMIVKDGAFVEAAEGEVTIKKVTVDAENNLIKFDGTGKKFNISVANAMAGSVFTNLLGGDVVHVADLDKDAKISVNGKEWVSTTDDTAFTIYSDGPSNSRIVDGAIALTKKANTVDAASATGNATQTLTYTAGEKFEDGVKVVYADGVPTSITDLELSESVKVDAVGADGKKVVTEYTTAKGSADGKTVIYRTRGGVVTVKEINDEANVVDESDVGSSATAYKATVTDSKDAFDWTAAAEKKTTVYGYFLASEKGVVEAATQSEKPTSDYTQYGRTYLKVALTKDGEVTLTKATVDMTGKIVDGSLAETDKLDVTLTLPTEGLKIKSLTGRDADAKKIKSLTIVNAAAGTTVGTWTANDHITTVSLKAAYTKTDGTQVAAETIKLGTLTYTAGGNGVMELVGTKAKNGTFQLSKNMTGISSSYTNATTEATTVDAVSYTKEGGTAKIGTDTVNVKVENGRVTGLTGLGDKESIAILTTTTDKFGVTTTSTVTYTAAKLESGLNKGDLEVTKVLEDGTKFTHVFKDDKADVLASSVGWNEAGQDVTETTFNWNNTGYFKATLSAVPADAAKKIYVLTGVVKEGVTPNPVAGEYYLKVTSTKAMSGLVTISGMELVKVQDNGSFAAVKSGETLPKFTVDATNTGGLAFADGAHPEAAITITPAMGKTYTGLVAGDKVSGTSGTAAETKTITVNGTAYKVTIDSDAFIINGDNTIESGTFTVDGTAEVLASAVPQYATDTVNRSIVYTPGDTVKDGVVVTFGPGSTAGVVGSGSEIKTVSGVGNGEKVVITNYIGSLDQVNEVTTVTSDGTNVIKTMTSPSWPKDKDNKDVSIVMKAPVATIAGGDVLTTIGFTVTNKFDFGATNNGAIGFFIEDGAGDVTINTTPSAAFAGGGANWVIVGAKTDANKNVTITHLQVIKDDGHISLAKSNQINSLSIDASKVEGGITLDGSAVKLCTEYTYDEDKKAWVVDKAKSDTDGREYDIAVTGALAGKAYKGFADDDTITTGTLKADDTITVGDLTYALKSAGTASFYGSGAANTGVFKFNSTYKEARGYNGANKLTTITGSADATVEFAAGSLKSITEIGVGETVTVTELNTLTKAVTTTKYTATAGETTGEIKITRETTKDGVTTTAVGKYTNGDLQDITKVTYTDTTSSISSTFDWTTENGSGYFITTVTLEGATVKDIGTINIKPTTTTISPSDAGKYVAKVTVNTRNGRIDSITLHKVGEIGELSDPIAIPNTATGTLNITAPDKAVKVGDEEIVPGLVFDKTGFDKLTVNITGAANGSVITKLGKGDTLTTAALKKVVYKEDGTIKTAAEQITISDGTTPKVYVAGADGVMKFVDAGVMTDGTIVMNGALTIDATGELASKYSDATKITIAHTGADAPVVTIKDGVLSAYDRTTLTTGSVTMTVTSTNASAKYEAAGVTVTLGKTKTSLSTLAMSKYDMVKLGTRTLYSGADNNKIDCVRDTGSEVMVKNGVLQMTKANDQFTVTGTKLEDASDNVVVKYVTKTTSTAVNVKVTNGAVTSITGLGAGDSISVAEPGPKTTVYTIDKTTPTKVTKVVTQDGKDTTYTAFITASETADILAANYFGEGQDISSEDNAIVGQLSWADVSGRSTGYFALSSKNAATIAEQSQKVTVTAGKGKTALYAVANVKDSDDGNHVQTLSIDALQVSTSSDGKTTTVIGSGVKLLAGAAITVTAPTTAVDGIVPPLYYDKGTGEDAPTYAITLNKVAKNSVVKNIALGDKVVTNTLKAAVYKNNALVSAAESVQMAEADGTLITYRAGANGALTFVGEGDNTKKTDPTSVARLLSGTVILTAGAPVYLAGAAEKDKAYSGDANDLKVTATVDGNVVVNVKNGVISTVTGFDTDGATLVVTKGTGESTRYTIVDSDATNKTVTIERITWTGDLTDEKEKSATKTYRTVKKAADFYAGDQTKTFKAMETQTPTLTDWTAEGTKYAFIKTTEVATANEYAFTTTAAKKAGVTSDVITDGFQAVPDVTYYRLSAKTAKNGMTTITGVDAMVADAASKKSELVVVKPVNGISQVFGTVRINAATEVPANEKTNGKITFALPTYETKRWWTLDAKNLALGSVITGISKLDKVASGDGTYELTSKDKTFTVYTNGEKTGTSTEVVTYSGKDGATAKVKDGVLTITNMVTEKEKVTVVTDKDTAGLVTTEYLVLAGGMIQKTETSADGLKTVCTSKTAAKADEDIIKALEYGDIDTTKTTVVSDFNWTLDKSQVGYFAVAKNAAAVKTAKTTITAKQATGTTYIAVELDGTNGQDAVVKSVKAVTFDFSKKTLEDMVVEASEGSFTGKITITAPTTAMVFDRTTALNTDKDSISANAPIAITGAAAWSTISGLKARGTYDQCDSVTTAKLKAKAYNADGTVKTWPDGVWVNNIQYTAGANGALGFTMQQVNGEDDERVTLTSGTIWLEGAAEGELTEGANAAIVGKKGIVAGYDENLLKSSGITVAATTKVSKGVATTSYTIGDLDENESFQVLTYGDDTMTSGFKKSTSNLFYKADGAASDGTDGKYVYALGGKTSVSSSVLDINAAKIPTAKGWKTVVETFTEGTNNFLTTTYGAVTVDLATLDKRYAADFKKNNASNTYAFVYDTYLASGTKAAKALNAAVVKTRDQDIQTLIGNVTQAGSQVQHRYVANGLLAQTIKAADKWRVIGSDAADTITGASSGNDTLNGSLGNDLLTGGGAKDYFVVGDGQDTIKSYASGKDTVQGWFANVSLQGADVLLWNDNDGSESYNEGDDSVLLVGMGNKKAVTIRTAGDVNYYFGSGKATKAETFTFDVSQEQVDQAIYHGKENLANTVSIGTSKTKATAKTLGDTLVVDLTDATRYINIASADASKSGNRVDLTAAAKGSTLKGGTYESTLRGGEANDMLYGGSGVDVFWAENLSGSDTVKSYQTSKDAVFLGNIDEDPEVATEVNNFTITASGKNVLLTKGDASMLVEGAAASATKAFKISKDGTSKNTLSYYIGNASAKANKFTATMDTDMKSVTTKVDDKDVTTVTMSSYYLGSSAMNVDTLTLKSSTKNANIGKFDMNTLARYISTIDVIDTASLAKGSTIELIGRESGTYTLKGSNNVNETFNLKSLAVETKETSNNVTITNLGVGEVIELAAGMTVSMSTSGKNTICTLKDGDNSYGMITISGVATSKLTYDKTSGKLTRTTK